MQVTVIALLCHSIAGLSDPVCHEAFVTKDDMPMAVCTVLNEVVDAWQEASVYRGYEWSIASVTCHPGEYLPKDVV